MKILAPGLSHPASLRLSLMADQQELGALIRESRLKRGLSLGQLASAVGRSSSSVRRWERGEVAPAATVLATLAEVLDIDPVALGDAKPPVDGTDDGDSGVFVSTVEQPEVKVSEAVPQPPMEPMGQTSDRGGIFADAWRILAVGRQKWIGWVRGLLTAGALIGMLAVLIWAVGELLDAIGAIIDSFDVGSSTGDGS